MRVFWTRMFLILLVKPADLIALSPFGWCGKQMRHLVLLQPSWHHEGKALRKKLTLWKMKRWEERRKCLWFYHWATVVPKIQVLELHILLLNAYPYLAFHLFLLFHLTKVYILREQNPCLTFLFLVYHLTHKNALWIFINWIIKGSVLTRWVWPLI